MLRPTALVLSLLSCALLAPAPALAAGGTGGKKPKKPALELKGLLPSLGAVPRAEGLVAPTAAPAPAVEGTRQSAGPARYEVLEVVHAAGFVPGPGHPMPVGARLTAVALVGTPPLTPHFSTLVRLRSAGRAGAPIEVVVLDAKGETVMSSSGTVAFGESDQTHFQVDWEPSPLAHGGAYQVLVRVAGEPLGTWPLQVKASDNAH